MATDLSPEALVERVARAEAEIEAVKKTTAFQYANLHTRVAVLEKKLLRWGGLGLVITMLVEKML